MPHDADGAGQPDRSPRPERRVPCLYYCICAPGPQPPPRAQGALASHDPGPDRPGPLGVVHPRCRNWLGCSHSLGWCGACTARGWGATGGGSGVLRVGGAFVQYAQPSTSRSRPSWSKPTPGAQSGTDISRRRTTTSWPPVRESEGLRQGAAWSDLRRRRWALPHAHSRATQWRTPRSSSGSRSARVLLRSPVSTALTSAGPPSKRRRRIVGMLRFVFGVRRRCGGDVSTMDTSDPTDRFRRPAVDSRATTPTGVGQVRPQARRLLGRGRRRWEGGRRLTGGGRRARRTGGS